MIKMQPSSIMRNPIAIVALCLLSALVATTAHPQQQHASQQQQQHHQSQQYSLSEADAQLQTNGGGSDTMAGRRFKRMYAMCPPHFSRIGNECYFISQTKQNWLDAHFECKDRNSKLAEPMKFDDKSLRKHLLSTKEKNYIWIGGNYNWRANKWQWGYNGKDIAYQSFSQMVPGSSQDLKYHCAVLNPDLKFRWSAKLCTEKLNFICQHKMPFVNSHSRSKVYSRWNATFPNELANEVEVVVANQPRSSKQRDYYTTSNYTTVSPTVLYNRFKNARNSNRTVRIRPSRRRVPNHNRQQMVKNDYISNEVYRRPVVEYAQDNSWNGNGNGNGNGGYRNGNGGFQRGFNVDIARQRPHKKMNRMNEVGGEYRPHQHRHHLGNNNNPGYVVPRPATTAGPAATTATTTTTPAPETLPTEAMQLATERVHHGGVEQQLSHAEKKARRDKLRERLNNLSPEEKELFYAERAKRKRNKLQRSKNETIP